MSFCPIPTGGGAYPIVQSGWNDFKGYAATSLSGALAQASVLASFNVAIPNPTVAFEVAESIGQFQAPTPPVAPDVTVTIPTELTGYSVGSIETPNFGEAPELSATIPPVNFGGKPLPFNKQLLGEVPDLINPTIPTQPVVTLPTVPDLRDITIPRPPETVLPTLSAVAPTFGVSAPNNSFNFTEELYSSANLTKIQAQVSTMLDGGTGLPANLEQVLFDRGRKRTDQIALKSSRESLEEWSSRGFSLPSGIVDERMRIARQENQDANNSLNRDLTIQFHEKEIEQLNFAITQGVALENILIQAHLAIEQRKFDTLRFITEANISLFNARVAQYNAELQGYETDVKVYVEKIRAELTKLELYKSQIEAQRLIGEINQQDVTLYTAQVNAAKTVVDIFVAEVNAARTIVETNRAQIEAFRAQVDAFTAEVNAKSAEFDAWATSIRGEVAKLEGFKYEVQAFAEEVRAYSAQNEAFRYIQISDIEREKLFLSGFQAQLENFRAKVQAEATRVSATAQVFDGQAKLYAASGAIASAQSDSEQRRVQIEIGRERSRTDVELRNTTIAASNALDASRLVVAAQDGAARTYAATASAALSAVNLSASISASDSSSLGCSTSFNIETTA